MPTNKNVNKRSTTKKYSRGYTLLFAIIVASVVLSIGVTILTVSRKEFILSSSARESSSAFYAADSGLGCAEYWDANVITTFLASSSPATFSIACNATPVTVTKSSPVGQSNCAIGECDFTFSAPFSTDGTNNESCAYVTVAKYFAKGPADPTTRLYTQITSNGYNIGWNPPSPQGTGSGTGDCSTVSPKKVERAIQLTY